MRFLSKHTVPLALAMALETRAFSNLFLSSNVFENRLELAGEISNREQPAQLEYFGIKMHPTALSPSAASRTRSY